MPALRLITAAVACLSAVTATIYECSPDGLPYTIEAALAVAGPGDTVSLADGVYREPIVTMAHGEDGNPLVIEGGPGAIISAFSGDRSLMWSQKVVDIRHSWTTLRVRLQYNVWRGILAHRVGSCTQHVGLLFHLV